MGYTEEKYFLLPFIVSLLICVPRNMLLSLRECNHVVLLETEAPLPPEVHQHCEPRRMLVLEHCSNALSDNLLSPDWPNNPKEALLAFIPVCQGVAECHQKGVAHLWICPENILYSMNSAQFKLSNFSRAKRASAVTVLLHREGRPTLRPSTQPPEFLSSLVKKWLPHKIDVTYIYFYFSHHLDMGTWSAVISAAI